MPASPDRLDPRRDDFGLRPFDARSLTLSVLLGLPDPGLPARALVALGERFDLAPGTMRTALSRMVGRGELSLDDGTYGLGPVHLDRRAAQRLATEPEARWDGSWWVLTTVEGRDLAERRAVRTTLLRARFGEVRPGVWMRPGNVAAPVVDDALVVRGPLAAGDPVALAARLWPPAERAAVADRLLAELDRRGDPDPAQPDTLASSIMLAAAVVRCLADDPLLPAELAPPQWPFDELRRRYRTYDRRLGELLQAVVDDV